MRRRPGNSRRGPSPPSETLAAACEHYITVPITSMTASRQRPQSSRTRCRQGKEAPPAKRPGSAPKASGLPTRFKPSEHAAAAPWQVHWRAAYPKQLVEAPRIPVDVLMVETELYRAGISQSWRQCRTYDSAQVDRMHAEMKDQLSKQGLLTRITTNKITRRVPREPKLKKQTTAANITVKSPSFDSGFSLIGFPDKDDHDMDSSEPPAYEPSFLKRASMLAASASHPIQKHEETSPSPSLSPRPSIPLPRASLPLPHGPRTSQSVPCGTKQLSSLKARRTSFAVFLQRNNAPTTIDEQDEHTDVPGSVESMERQLLNVGGDSAEAAALKLAIKDKLKDEALHHHGSFEHCVMLSRKHMVDLSEIKRCLVEFRRMDTDGDNCVMIEEFEEYIRGLGYLSENQELPPSIAASFLKLDTDCNGHIDFEEFVGWALEANWMEGLLVVDPEDLENRALARKHGMSILAVEDHRRHFRKYDEDGSGDINKEEFVDIVIDIMKIKNRDDAPLKRLERCWQEVDTDKSGIVSFEEFLVWMKRAEDTGHYL
eukprot:TRINITY_DN42411_c0_g1_i1.p1 TRINITY_DN42411_c0_g1~~TRINITY_DN42411_c0_g1_i1.p1  ORF type:complete len:543 (+),score=96.51 TRINITY_DN42411_c0_g1_i1:98-1726(+)